jgi:hypothetical protein
MFPFLGGRKEKSSSQQTDIPKGSKQPGEPKPKGIEDSGIVVDKSKMPVSPAGMYSYALDDDLAPSELSSSAYSYNQYLTQIENDHGVQSFESMGGPSGATPDTPSNNEPMTMPQQQQDKNNGMPMHSNGPSPLSGSSGAYDARSPRVGSNGVHAISYVTQALEHGYATGYEDDLSTLGDESIIRRGRRNQQKQQELKAKQLEHQLKQNKKHQHQKPNKNKGNNNNNNNNKLLFDKTKISKAHTRSTEEISPSGESRESGDLSFSFSNVLDVNEKIPDSSRLGFDITDDSLTDGERGQRALGGSAGDPGYDAEKKMQESFFQRNKWSIIKFIIVLSLFLLIASAAVMVVSLLHMRKIANNTEASIVDNGGEGEPSDFANDGIPSGLVPVPFSPIYIPPEVVDVDVTATSTATVAVTASPSSPPPPTDNSFNTMEVTMAPTEAETDVVTQSPSEPPSSITLSPTVADDTVSTSFPTSGSGFVSIVNSVDSLEQTKVGTDLRFVIANLSPTSLTFLDDPESAQNKAFDWMTKDPSYWSMDISTIVQRWTLAVLYYSTGGPNWKTEQLPDTYAAGKSPWLSYSDECLWESSNEGTQGRICDSDNNYFAIHLRKIGLTGTLPAELGLLSDHMSLLFFNSNELTGSLPTELGQLTALEKINLQYNNFSGSLPTELGQWGALTIAAMGNNQFSGSIPSEMGLWGSCRTIGIEKNNFNGTLPKELSNMPFIEMISAEKNFFSGTIPSDFNFMYQLTSLSLQTNDLTGEMQWGLCPGCYSVVDLKADCEEIKCDCCTECFTDSITPLLTLESSATTTASVSTSTAGLRAGQIP